jgi:amylosucrase
MGDELAQRNDPSWSADPSHRHDNRWMHRPAMDWAAAERRSVPGSLEHRVHAMIRRLAAARRALPSLGGGGSTTLLDLGRPGLFGYRRSASGAPAVLALVDVAGTGQVIDADELACAGISDPRPADLGGESATFADGLVHLPPYGFAWLTG